jgi:capsule polysaccharide export protein KpsC/LpsZ
MDKKQFLLLYKGLIIPITDYGKIIYYPVTKKNKQMLENTQRRATRIIPELKGLAYEQRFRALNLPTLDYRIQRGDMIQVFKLIYKIDDFDCEKLFQLSVTNHNIRGYIYKICPQHISF